MQGFPFSETDSGPFSPEEILELMRVEQERAARYGYPITLMLIEVDRLGSLHDLYGVASQLEVLRTAIREVRSTIRQSDFLGCLRERRILVLFPHVPQDIVAAVATRLLRSCRALEFDSDGRSLRPTLSIGASSLHPGEELDFEGFSRAAEEALAYAVASGGDRFVHRQSAGSVLAELRRELDLEAQSLRAGALAGAPAAHPGAPSAEPRAGSALEARIRTLFQALGEHSAELKALEEEVLRAVADGLTPRPSGAARGAPARPVEVLERRIKRLRELLDATEAELLVLARRKGVEPGVASIYRTVQGLREGDPDFARRREVLTLIFEANLALKRPDGDGGARPSSKG